MTRRLSALAESWVVQISSGYSEFPFADSRKLRSLFVRDQTQTISLPDTRRNAMNVNVQSYRLEVARKLREALEMPLGFKHLSVKKRDISADDVGMMVVIDLA